MSRKKQGKKFEHQLQSLVERKIFILIGVGAVLFFIALMAVNYYTNASNAKKNLEDLEEIFLDINENEEAFLKDDITEQLFIMLLDGTDDGTAMRYHFNRFNTHSPVRNQIVVSDLDGKMLFTSYDDSELTNSLCNYIRAVCYHADAAHNDIYHSVYYNPVNYNDYMYIRPIYKERKPQEIAGYVTLLLSGSDWNYYLSDRHFDGVIIDDSHNVIYSSKAGFMGNVRNFYGTDSMYYYLNQDKYWVMSKTLMDKEVTIYSLVYCPENADIIIGLFVILIMGVIWFVMARSMTRSMAEHNAAMIHELVGEIRIIQKENPEYRIQMKQGNEFDEVANKINDMLDSLDCLNKRNMELLNINNTIELNQLTAQINPHFLYNTLEIIRSLVMWEPESASEMIIKLTDVLRYSINRTMMDVYLEEDIKYIMEYLDIQKRRFGERFVCEMNIEPECRKCLIPKLLLQPIIENSIKYGFQKKMNIHVSVDGWMEGNTLKLCVKDNGPGMSKEEAEKKNHDIMQRYDMGSSHGLHNISRRLHLQYGGESGIQMWPGETEGLNVLVTIVQN